MHLICWVWGFGIYCWLIVIGLGVWFLGFGLVLFLHVHFGESCIIS